MWDACVGVYQLLNWKMHGETLKLTYKSDFLRDQILNGYLLPSVAPLNVSSGCILFNFFDANTGFDYSLYEVLTALFSPCHCGTYYAACNPRRRYLSAYVRWPNWPFAVLPFLTTFPDVSSLRCAVSCQNVEASRYVVCTFALLFRETRTSNKHWFILQKFLQFNEQLWTPSQ